MAYTTINKSTDYFNTKLYTGNGSTQSITGVGFQPDWVWFKTRSATSHMLQDAVRGTTKFLETNTTTGDQTSSDGISSFNSDGYAIGGNGRLNSNGTSMVSWNWKAGNSSGSANTDGAVSSTVSVNTTAGFSIVSYAGSLSSAGSTTVGHGLGAVPQLIIAKSRTAGENWAVYHKDLTANYLLQLNTTSAQINTTSEGSFSAPTSSVFTTNYRGEWNNTGQNYIAYCFAEKKGFSKFGSYTGNGNANGTFIYTGFKPAFVMVKNASSTNHWIVLDNKREGYNPQKYALFPNQTNAETGDYLIDFTSSGFKVRTATGALSENGETLIYMAFAEAPLVGSNNLPATAR
jgi:hypothetical protein